MTMPARPSPSLAYRPLRRYAATPPGRPRCRAASLPRPCAVAAHLSRGRTRITTSTDKKSCPPSILLTKPVVIDEAPGPRSLSLSRRASVFSEPQRLPKLTTSPECSHVRRQEQIRSPLKCQYSASAWKYGNRTQPEQTAAAVIRMPLAAPLQDPWVVMIPLAQQALPSPRVSWHVVERTPLLFHCHIIPLLWLE